MCRESGYPTGSSKQLPERIMAGGRPERVEIYSEGDQSDNVLVCLDTSAQMPT